MKNILKTVSIFVSCLCVTQASSEQNELFAGSVETIIELNPQPFTHALQTKALGLSLEEITNTKIISLMRLNLTPEMIEKVEKAATEIQLNLTKIPDYAGGIKPFQNSKTSKILEMNDVPVLDQGKHGTCVTFATTAALDALIGKGDFISQQCTLAHNLYLGNDHWNGASSPEQVIEPLKQFGVVEKSNCATKYPNPSQKIKTAAYKKLIDSNINLEKVEYNYSSFITVDEVRAAIQKGHRVAIAFMLQPHETRGFDARFDDNTFKGGLWACTYSESKRRTCGYSMTGHEAIIIGYDDEQKLFKLRNSWGSAAGINGDFYMTYEFLKVMALDATEFWTN